MKRVVLLLVLTWTTTSWATTVNEFEEREEATLERKVPWRGSLFVYENLFSAMSLSKSAELTYNPYYVQSLSFRPRYYVRDDLSLRLRMDLEIELTTSDNTDRARQWILSDTLFDVVYGPKWMQIPYAEVDVSPSLRLTLPTSINSRGRSLMLGIGPGVAFKRKFDLLKGAFLQSVGVMYAFRGTKYLHEYTTAQVDTAGICSMTNPLNPACHHSGRRNRSWRLTNFFEVRLQIMEKLSFAADLFLLNDLLHELDGEVVPKTEETPEVALSGSEVNHRASTWAIFDLSYDVLDWLSLSAGISTYYPHLAPDSSYRTPLFNRYTTFYFDVAIPVDRFVDQVQSWTGWGS